MNIATNIPKSELKLSFRIYFAIIRIILMEMIILVERKEYLERLIQWKDEQVIKSRYRNPPLRKVHTAFTVSKLAESKRYFR